MTNSPAQTASDLADIFERWLSAPNTWIGVFENHDLGHPAVGQRTAMAFDQTVWDNATIGQTRMPDTKHAIGWRYILVAKCRTIDEALAAMSEGEIK